MVGARRPGKERQVEQRFLSCRIAPMQHPLHQYNHLHFSHFCHQPEVKKQCPPILALNVVSKYAQALDSAITVERRWLLVA